MTSRLPPTIAAHARKRGAVAVALYSEGALLFLEPVRTADALELLEKLPPGTPQAPTWIEWYEVPRLHAVED